MLGMLVQVRKVCRQTKRFMKYKVKVIWGLCAIATEILHSTINERVTPTTFQFDISVIHRSKCHPTMYGGIGI